jgi:hypothetical protein
MCILLKKPEIFGLSRPRAQAPEAAQARGAREAPVTPPRVAARAIFVHQQVDRKILDEHHALS